MKTKKTTIGRWTLWNFFFSLSCDWFLNLHSTFSSPPSPSNFYFKRINNNNIKCLIIAIYETYLFWFFSQIFNGDSFWLSMLLWHTTTTTTTTKINAYFSCLFATCKLDFFLWVERRILANFWLFSLTNLKKCGSKRI